MSLSSQPYKIGSWILIVQNRKLRVRVVKWLAQDSKPLLELQFVKPQSFLSHFSHWRKGPLKECHGPSGCTWWFSSAGSRPRCPALSFHPYLLSAPGSRFGVRLPWVQIPALLCSIKLLSLSIFICLVLKKSQEKLQLWGTHKWVQADGLSQSWLITYLLSVSYNGVKRDFPEFKCISILFLKLNFHFLNFEVNDHKWNIYIYMFKSLYIYI